MFIGAECRVAIFPVTKGSRSWGENRGREKEGRGREKEGRGKAKEKKENLHCLFILEYAPLQIFPSYLY